MSKKINKLSINSKYQKENKMTSIYNSKNINLARIDTHGGNVQLGDNYYMSAD